MAPLVVVDNGEGVETEVCPLFSVAGEIGVPTYFQN